MKVWHLTKSLYGGAGIYALRLSDALRGLGIDSCVLSADSQGPSEMRRYKFRLGLGAATAEQ